MRLLLSSGRGSQQYFPPPWTAAPAGISNAPLATNSARGISRPSFNRAYYHNNAHVIRYNQPPPPFQHTNNYHPSDGRVRVYTLRAAPSAASIASNGANASSSNPAVVPATNTTAATATNTAPGSSGNNLVSGLSDADVAAILSVSEPGTSLAVSGDVFAQLLARAQNIRMPGGLNAVPSLARTYTAVNPAIHAVPRPPLPAQSMAMTYNAVTPAIHAMPRPPQPTQSISQTTTVDVPATSGIHAVPGAPDPVQSMARM